MASTHAKNATKPNSFKILQLQTARKKIKLDDLKNVGESNYNPGDGTDQRVQSLVFMMMTFHNTRPVGRPRTRWADVVQRDALQLLGGRGWRRRAESRDEWRHALREAKARKGL